MNRWSKSVLVVAVLSSVVLITAMTVKQTQQEPRSREIPISHALTSTPEALFVPITPCRIVDTRLAVGALAPNAARSYYAAGTTGFAPQGGKSGGCGIPVGATAVNTTVTAVSATGTGFVRAYPAGGAMPTATLLNYSAVNTGTTSALPVRNGAGTDLTLRNFGSTTHLVVDVNGYYTNQMQAYIGSSGSIVDQSGRLVSATKTATGQYTLVWDRDIGNCSGQATSDLTGYIMSVYTSGVNAYVYVYNNAGTATDYWANVLITC